MQQVQKGPPLWSRTMDESGSHMITPTPLGDLVLRNPGETSSRGSSYLVGPREWHLDWHHLLWSLLSWIAVMNVTCYTRESPTSPRVWGTADTIVSIVQLGSWID